MALGIASAGLLLYSVVPQAIVVQDYLSGPEAISFLGGLKYAYLFGGALSAVATVLTLMQSNTIQAHAQK